ncbi:MAG: hypothetical protein AAGG68_08265 [Bacteroidota bacterium]
MQDFIKFMSHILKRPAMHGVYKVEDLSLIIFGYSFGCINSNNGDLNNKIGSLLKNMTEELRKESNDISDNSNYNWFELVRQNSKNDKDSLKKFQEIWHEVLEKISFSPNM